MTDEEWKASKTPEQMAEIRAKMKIVLRPKANRIHDWIELWRAQSAANDPTDINQLYYRTSIPRDKIKRLLKDHRYLVFKEDCDAGRVNTFHTKMMNLLGDAGLVDYIRSLVPVALAKIEKCMASPDEKIALQAALQVLDREGTFDRKFSQSHTVEHHIPEKELERAREIARELRVAQPRMPALSIGGQEQGLLEGEIIGSS